MIYMRAELFAWPPRVGERIWHRTFSGLSCFTVLECKRETSPDGTDWFKFLPMPGSGTVA